MMHQPELGKKIADLRKAKGLTQEELVDKCNLNVRTLQRIESGEVTPRSYTLRLIFDALNYSPEEPQKERGFVQKRLEQFYISFIDLFNLKTGTMKKISILTVIICVIVTGVFTLNSRTIAQDNISPEINNSLPASDNAIVDTSMYYTNFRSKEMFYDKNELVSRDIKFTSQGVTIASTLIKVNQDTHEFITSFASGKISQDKVDVVISNEILVRLRYTADMIDKSYRKIHLRGNARIEAGDNRFIEAKEIIITTN